MLTAGPAKERKSKSRRRSVKGTAKAGKARECEASRHVRIGWRRKE